MQQNRSVDQEVPCKIEETAKDVSRNIRLLSGGISHLTGSWRTVLLLAFPAYLFTVSTATPSSGIVVSEAGRLTTTKKLKIKDD
jgi:hypothetical protein